MFGRTRRFWVGVALLLVGAILLFEPFLLGAKAPLVLFAVAVLVLAAGTLIVGVARRRRPV